MDLKAAVDAVLEKDNRSLNWLATQMDRTFDGLKLSLVKGTIKYTDILKMADILKVPAADFFPQQGTVTQIQSGKRNIQANNSTVAEPEGGYHSSRELLLLEQIELLKNQIRDKERIIDLMSRKG